MSIKENLSRVRDSLNEAIVKAGRKSEEVELMAVSKTKPIEYVREAYDAGQRVFGENRVLEAEGKFQLLPRDARVELIGHLQTNKAKTAVNTFQCIQTVDSLKLVEKLEFHCLAAGRRMDILLQLKTSDEISKTGLTSYEKLEELLEKILTMSSLTVRGLMTIAPFTDEEAVVRRAFARCRDARDQLASHFPDQDLSVLSMGMSSDYEWAVLEGSTQVRIGSAIFGARM